MSTKLLTRFIVLLSIAIIPLTSSTQHLSQCGHDHVLQHWLAKNPRSINLYQQTLTQRKNSNSGQSGNRTTRIVIPVVFHILHLNGPENIGDAQIHDQIRILNRDYQKANPDTAQVVAAFKNNIANIDFEFQLASIDPDGNCTNGIVRHFTPKTIWNSSRLEDFSFTWPADSYLNIYIVKKIDIAPAYTFLPGIGIPEYADAVVCESWLVGSIGTASTANSRVLTHEIGHWFGLPHIWGVSNAPGVACGDDGVDDTPITKGFTICTPSNAKICDPTIVENVQNYMDYSPCKLMFTNGQAAYMRETITLGLNKRDRLSSEENLRATGLIGDQPCVTNARFYAANYTICKGESIEFFDQSQAGSDASTRAWYIPGAIPSFSTDSILDVTFDEAGEYEVKLIISGPNGVDSLSRFIRVFDGTNGTKTPISYTFQNGFLPSTFQIFTNQAGDPTWETLSSVGADNTDGCVFVNNSGSKVGEGTYLETPFFDFTDNPKPSMSYYYAYAKNKDTQADTFRLEYTLDCGKSWRVFSGIPTPNTMAINTGGVTADAFYPVGPQQWKKVNLTTAFQLLFKNKLSVKFRFYFRSDPASNGANNIFIDEINVKNETISATTEQDGKNISIYPNPSTSGIKIDINDSDAHLYTIEMINSVGQQIKTINHPNIEFGKISVFINQDAQMKAGIYMIRIKKVGFLDIIKKVVILS